MADSGGRVFISYRRDDAPYVAGRLADRLGLSLPKVEVFMDVETIGLGEDFGRSISQAVAASDILIAIIGQKWLDIVDAQGGRRLDQSDDWVRREISTALRAGLVVMPVLADGAELPHARELPHDLADLAMRNAARIDYDTFTIDVNRLIDAIEATLNSQRVARSRLPGMSGRPLHSKPASTHRREAPSRLVPFHRSAVRVLLWWIAFLVGTFTGVIVGLTLAGRMPPNPVGNIIANCIFVGLLAGVILLIRREIRSEHSLAVRAASSYPGMTMPKALSIKRFALLLATLSVYTTLFLVAALLSPT